ncbi:MBL fold metallo-hydrolase [Dendrosporobacter sp. 1207_IL3150]|uniref:MBL fold metallo-hydrolase n=1 Tax=Dendrosporobacter sp. 1207_IL3150 TaxID=3084054 RepID=UPI002FDA5192
MRLTFLGAAKMVTGSSFLLEVGSKKLLVDCGMFQGSKPVRALNYRDFAFDPTSLDYVLLTHAHIDHSGLLPKLCKSGFRGPIFATKVTAELCNIMLPDSAHIQEFDAEIANRKGQRAGKKPVEPLYTIEDAYNCLQQFSPVLYDSEFQLSEEITVRFRDAGHILGSSIVEVVVNENGKKTKLLFSGDLGQPDQPIIKDPTLITEADFIITESTYGNRKHEQYDKEEKLAEIINDTMARGGNIIIPSFAVGRTQAILYYLHKLLKAGKIQDIPVIIDSPLAISATDIFMHNTQEYDSEAYDMLVNDKNNPLKLPQLKFTKTADESKALNSMDHPAIIISASGMADAGRILHHLKHNLWRPESSILFVGYQAEGSMGRRLIEGAKRVKIMGEEISVKAQIYNLDGFSAHADQDQLLDWLSNFSDPKPANIFLVHGEADASGPLAEIIKERLDLSSYIPQYGDVAIIDGREWRIEQTDLSSLEPSVKELEDYLNQAEVFYNLERKRLVNIVANDPSKLSEVIIRIEKVLKYLKKLTNDL